MLPVTIVAPQVQEHDYTGTPYVPIFVMLPLGLINMECELVDPDNLINQLRILKSSNVDGVMVDCWWGIKYNWSGYRKLFQIVQDLDLKLQVVMSFHECGSNVGDDVHIPLPKWIMEIGSKNPDIFFTDREGRRNHECLTWGIDKQRVLEGRNALEGLNHGWEYPDIGEFQCYDKYLMESLVKAAEARGHLIWGRAPNNAVLVDRADRVLAMANIAFEENAYCSEGIHWWYKTASHAAELTAGFYNPANRDGYATIASVLKKHEATLNFTCVELRTLDQHEDFPEALADPEGLVWQVLNAAWDADIPVASENALPCYDKEGYNKILDIAKPFGDLDGRHLSAFTYLRLTPQLLEEQNFMEFERFVKRVHGEFVENVQPHHEEETEEAVTLD
ncbi:hypothetical protein SASPL_111385 [Salvia splendens]|uniref:Beta-amylase n=1 Tax=Salvia splendens TaxID=180675 RepID=A0A8X8YBT6_SALSN|nr:hypothetical protein SASPL_111385 [Salvia splendens]